MRLHRVTWSSFPGVVVGLAALGALAAGCVSPRESPIMGADAGDSDAAVGDDAEATDAPAAQGSDGGLADARDDLQAADAPDAPLAFDAADALARDTSGEDTGPDTGTARSANGTACTSGASCTSNHCVDGVCCESACNGQCEACAESGSPGRCLAVTGEPRAGRAACAGKGSSCGGACDGANRAACGYPGAQKECVPASCTAGTATLRAGCNGQGACPTALTVSCAPLMCDGTICAGGCNAANPCTAGNYCEGGRCLPKKGGGSQCLDASQCSSGACADGVCCNTSCDGACQSCNLAGSAGSCSPVKSADDDHCNGQLTCDAAGACKRKRGGGCTGSGDCASGFCVDGVCCDRACSGQCEACAESSSPGTCVTVTGTPRSPRAGCGGSAECAGTCNGSISCSFPAVACGPAASCSNNVLTKRGTCSAGTCQSGGTQNCGNYACSASSGTCPTSCSGNGDCAAGFACTANKCATPPSPAVSVGTSGTGSCAVLMNGKIVCWGTTPRRPAGLGPYEVPGITNAVKVTLDTVHLCALTTDRKVLCWGDNGGGQLGDGTTTSRDTPGPVPSSSPWTNASELCSVTAHSLALVGGTVYGWGNNSSGAIGQPTSTPQAKTPLAINGTGTASLLACNDQAGSVFTGTQLCSWGSNISQLTNADTAVMVTQPPVCVAAAFNFVELSGGSAFSCGRLDTGAYRCWGSNSLGQYGMGMSSAGGPAPGTASTGVSIKRIAANGVHACAIFADDRLRCWGGNFSRQLGTGSTNSFEASPQPVLDLGTDIAAVSSNGAAQHTCVVKTDGSVWCWGANDSGQIGTGSTSTSVDRPTRVSF